MRKKQEDLKKLKLLFTIAPQGKREVIMDFLEGYKVNLSLSFNGRGTSTNEIADMLGLHNNNRDIIVSFIRADMVEDAILGLEDKFKKFKNNQSIAFAIPMASIIGMQNYLFLANMGGEYLGK